MKAIYWNDNALYIASIGKFEVRNTLPNGTSLPLYVPWGYTHTGTIWKVTSNTTKLLPPKDAPIYYRCMFLSIIGIVVVRYGENINENSNTNSSPFENNCLPRNHRSLRLVNLYEFSNEFSVSTSEVFDLVNRNKVFSTYE